MTICIATICDQNTSPTIIFCADRLVTDANGLTFEQGIPKIDYIDDNCLVMSAGLGAESDEIIKEVVLKVKHKSEENNNQRLRIKDIASIFKKEHQKSRNEKLTDEILKPRGLTLESFYANIKSFPEWLGILLDTQISNYEFEVDFLVFGFDVGNDGLITPHIYEINEKGEMQTLDKIGFGIIGIGDIMSLPEITKEVYSPTNSLSDAIVRTYWAKKSAERVISVGKATTDLGLIWTDISKDKKLEIKNVFVNEEFKNQLNREFEKQSETIKQTTSQIQSNINDIFSGKKSVQTKSL